MHPRTYNQSFKTNADYLSEANHLAFGGTPSGVDFQGRVAKAGAHIVAPSHERELVGRSRKGRVADLGDAVIQRPLRKRRPAKPASRPLNGKRALAVSKYEYAALTRLGDVTGVPEDTLIRWYKTEFSGLRRQIYSRILSEHPDAAQRDRPLVFDSEMELARAFHQVPDIGVYSQPTPRDLAITLGKARRYKSQLNGTHGEVTGTDDHVDGVDPVYTIVDGKPFIKVITGPSLVQATMSLDSEDLEVWKMAVSEDEEFTPIDVKTTSGRGFAFASHCTHSALEVIGHIRRLLPGLATTRMIPTIVSGVSGGVFILIEALGLGGGKKSGGGKKKQSTQVSVRRAEHYDPRPAVHMSKCAARLAIAHSNPFDPAVVGVCGIGGVTAGDTLKNTTSIRVDVTIGTAGYGFMMLSPGLCNDNPQGFKTNASFVGTGGIFQALSADDTLNTGVETFFATRMPMEAGYLVAGTAANSVPASGRMLAVGVRGMYTGKADARGGTILVHNSPIHSNESVWQTAASGTISFSKILGYEDVQIFNRLEEEDILLVDHPRSVEERGFPTGDASNLELVYPFSANENNLGGFTFLAHSGAAMDMGAPSAIVAIQGTPGNSYMFEVIYHSEFSGSLGTQTTGSATRSELDNDGEEMVLNSLTGMDGKRKPRDRWKALREGLIMAGRRAAAIAIPATEAALSAALMG